MIDISIKRRKSVLPRVRIVHKKGYVSLFNRVKHAVSNRRPRFKGYRVLNLRLPRFGFGK